MMLIAGVLQKARLEEAINVFAHIMEKVDCH
jgi:hypothetical protein